VDTFERRSDAGYSTGTTLRVRSYERHARSRIRPKVAQTVIAESGFNGPVGTVFALAVAGSVVSGQATLSGPAFKFAWSLLLGTLIGVVAGIALSYLVSYRKGGAWRESPAVAILAVIALSYFSVEYLGGSGYLAAFVMGLIVGNMELFRLGQHARRAGLLEGFASQVAGISVLLVFVTLGVNMPFEALNEYLIGSLVVMAVFIFVARPLTVLACLLPDRRGRWARNELIFLSWCRETGVIPAALAALLLSQSVPGTEIAVSMVALAVCVTLLLQATTAGPLARRLGLVEES
jgi:cell volume regulation protein A